MSILETRTISWKSDTVYYIDEYDKCRQCPIQKDGTRSKIISHQVLFTDIFCSEPYSVEYFKVAINCHTAYYITFHYHNGNGYNFYNIQLNRNMLSYSMLKEYKYIFKNKYKSLDEQIEVDQQEAQMEFRLIGPSSTKNRFLGRSYTTTPYISLQDLIDNIEKLRESINKMLIHVHSVRIIQKLYLHYRLKRIVTIKKDLELYVIEHSITNKPLLRRLSKSTLLSEFIKLKADMIKFIEDKIKDAEIVEAWEMQKRNKCA